MYFPFLGSHFTIWCPGSKHCVVICETLMCSWKAFSAGKMVAFLNIIRLNAFQRTWNNGSVSCQREMDLNLGTICERGMIIWYPGIRDQICLKLCEIDIQRSVKAQRGRNRRDNLGDQTVKICVCWSKQKKLKKNKQIKLWKNLRISKFFRAIS
jgi:hypothetical protein